MTSVAPALGAALDRWLERLDGQGFRVGVRERLLVQSMLARLAAHGELPAELRPALALATPLLCTSREQQRRYAVLLDAFVAADTADVAQAGSAGATAAAVAPRFGTVTAALAVVLSAAWLVWLWIGQPPPAAPVSTPTVVADNGAAAAEPAPTAASAPAFYVPPLPLPLQPALPPAWSEPARQSLLALGGCSALLLMGHVLARRRQRLALQGLRTDDEIEHHLLHDAEPVDVAPHPTLARAVARVLRQRVAGEARTLDTAATLRATIARGGAFTLRWRERQRTPEYLVLVDTRHPADHFAAAAHTLVDALSRAGVTLQVWAYDTTPAAGCWPRAGPAAADDDALPAARQRLPLPVLLTRAAGARLLVFGAADALLQPATGALQPWVAPLQTLAERAWFTPQPVHAWGSAEQAADDAGFLLLPLQEAALATLAGWLSSRRLTLALDADTPASFPPLLRGAALDWVTRTEPPPPETVQALLQQLREMLGGVRLQWLCACAVFPALTPPLTLALGRHVVSDPRDLALGLAALSALPWFRYGRMPVWLRRELRQRLAPDLRQTLDGEVRQRLDAALAAGAGSETPLLADIATRRARLLAALRQRKGLLQDVVLADFVREGIDEGLAHRLSPKLRRRLFRHGDPSLGLRGPVLAVPALLLATALLAATPLWPALVGTVPQPALAAIAGGVAADEALALPADRSTRINGLLAIGEALILVDEGEDKPLTTLNFSETWRQVGGGGTALPLEPSSSPTTRSDLRELADRLQPQNAAGIRLDWSSRQLLLRDAAGVVLGTALDTGGLDVQTAAFTPSGSRVVAVLADGSVRAWGRGWGSMSVPVAVVSCTGADPSLGLSGDIARQLVTPKSEYYEVAAYSELAWSYLRFDGAVPPRAGEVRFGPSQEDKAVATFLAGELSADPAFAGTPWTSVASTDKRPGVAIGACTTGNAVPAADGWAATRVTIPGLDAAAVQSLDARVRALYAADGKVGGAAYDSLTSDAVWSDAVALAIARALQAPAERPAGANAIFGISFTLSLLTQAPPASLNRGRADLQRLIARYDGTDDAVMRTQIASLQARLKAVAALKPTISIRIAGEFQRVLATQLAQRLQANQLQVTGIVNQLTSVEKRGADAPAATVLRVLGASDRRIARNLRDASAKVLGQAASLVSVAGDVSNDTYEIWLDRALCATRPVAGCSAVAAGGASAPAIGSPKSPASAASAAAAVYAAASAAMASIATPAAALASLTPNAATLDLIAKFEGFEDHVVKLPNGKQAIGYGHLLSATEADTRQIRIGGETILFQYSLVEADARRILAADLAPVYRELATLVTVPLTDNQRGALAAFTFNVGKGNLRSSTLLKSLNAGNYAAVPVEMARWATLNSQQLPGMQGRRQAEADLWNSGSPPSGAGTYPSKK